MRASTNPLPERQHPRERRSSERKVGRIPKPAPFPVAGEASPSARRDSGSGLRKCRGEQKRPGGGLRFPAPRARPRSRWRPPTRGPRPPRHPVPPELPPPGTVRAGSSFARPRGERGFWCGERAGRAGEERGRALLTLCRLPPRRCHFRRQCCQRRRGVQAGGVGSEPQ